MAEPSEPTLWRVGPDDLITAVEGGWDAFAIANGAPALASGAVVGRSIFDFIAGDETRRIHRLLLGEVRSAGRSLVVPFRCDSPDMRRYMQLELACKGGGEVEFRGILLRAEPRRHVRLLDPGERRGSRLVVSCSFCRRIRGPGEAWLDLDDAVTRLDMLGEPTPPRVVYGVCPACRSAISRRDDRDRAREDPDTSS